MSFQEPLERSADLTSSTTVSVLRDRGKAHSAPQGTLTLDTEHNALIWLPDQGSRKKLKRKSFRNSNASSIFSNSSQTPSTTSISSHLHTTTRVLAHALVIPLTYTFAVRYVNPEAALPLPFPPPEGSVVQEETDRFAIFWVERSKNEGHVRSITFHTPSSSTDASRWVRVLRHHLYPDSQGKPPLSRIFLILNPFGGTKKAPKIWNYPVKPMFELVGIQTTLVETERSGHAKELTQGMDVDAYDAVVTISGDGLIHEVMNGLCSRPDWKKAVKSLAVGTIPGGTVNAIPMNLDSPSPILCALSVIRGRRHPMDMHLITHYPSGSRYVSHLMFSWGLVADVDIESETYRWAGSARLNVGLAARLLNIRHYPGVLHYLTDDASEPEQSQEDEEEEGDENREEISESSGISLSKVDMPNQEEGHEPDGTLNSSSSSSSSKEALRAKRQSIGLDEEELEVGGIRSGLPGPRGRFTSPILSRELKRRRSPEDRFGDLPKGWKTVRSKFTYLGGNGNMPRISSDAMMAPGAKLSDGLLHLSWIENIGLWKLVPILLRMGDGTHIESPHVHHHRVRGFILEGERLEGGPGPSHHGGIINVDGEEVGRSCLGEAWAVEILPSLVTMIVPPWYEEK
ncbi:MAG: ATP-NAD kinase-like domain-containing protein [Piptocephalis tieghemiana]|nr:MAG: ATP-NAD kinase-like domain-containing protein [Piptocephalis tieghemiana]